MERTLKVMNAREYLERIPLWADKKNSLDSIRDFLSQMGNPEEKMRVIHVAGTNGKGSVLAYVSTVLQQAGYRVGRYISPTIKEYRERFQVDGKMITQSGLCKYLEQVKEAAEAMVAQGLPHPTAFEVETAAAFLFF